MTFLTETAGKEDDTSCPFTQDDINNAVTRLENSGLAIVDSSYVKGAIYLKNNYFRGLVMVFLKQGSGIAAIHIIHLEVYQNSFKGRVLKQR